MNFRQQLAKYVTGNLTTSQLPEIGVIGLEEGLDSPSLRILAGLGKYDSPFEIDQYFKLTLEELSIHLLDKRQAALVYALALVDEIIDREKDIIGGTGEIKNDAIGSYDFFSESKEYCYDSIGFDKAYGLYVEYNDLEDSDVNWQPNKSDDQLLNEIEAELFNELKIWREKLRNDA